MLHLIRMLFFDLIPYVYIVPRGGREAAYA